MQIGVSSPSVARGAVTRLEMYALRCSWGAGCGTRALFHLGREVGEQHLHSWAAAGAGLVSWHEAGGFFGE